ncbi:unnamed protein product, partial [Meganyctiphanes norvegica]
MVLLACYHLALGSLYAYAIYADVYTLDIPDEPWVEFEYNQYGGRLKFMTFLNMIIQTIYYSIALMNDLFGADNQSSPKRSNIQKCRDWLFTCIAFPSGWFVSIIFWSFYKMDPALTFPALDTWFPQWLNHVMHTLPSVATSLEVILVCHTYQMGVYRRYLPILTVYGAYISWMCYVALETGKWFYPVIEYFSVAVRIRLMTVLILPIIWFYILGEKMHNKV